MGNDDSKPIKKEEANEQNINADTKLAEVGLNFGRVGADHTNRKCQPDTPKARVNPGS